MSDEPDRISALEQRVAELELAVRELRGKAANTSKALKDGLKARPLPKRPPIRR